MDRLKEGEVELASQLILKYLLIVEGETLCICPAIRVEGMFSAGQEVQSPGRVYVGPSTHS